MLSSRTKRKSEKKSKTAAHGAAVLPKDDGLADIFSTRSEVLSRSNFLSYT